MANPSHRSRRGKVRGEKGAAGRTNVRGFIVIVGQIAGRVEEREISGKTQSSQPSAEVLAGIKKKGWNRSLKRSLDVYLLRDGLAFADYEFSRLFDDGKEKQGACVYVVCNSDDGWRIVEIFRRALNHPLAGR